MPRIDDATKQQRLERIYLLLTRNPRGLTEAEIADEINLERRTVNNYLREELEYQGKAFKDGIYWFPLVLKESRLRSFDLSPEEAVTLYLGARLLSKQQDKRNEPAETALLKLASVLKADAGVGNEIEQAARELAQRPTQKDYQPIFRDVVRGYIYRKKVEIVYHPLNKNSFPTTFSTYLLEPSPIGFTTYLIGHSSLPNALRAYKLERIESIRLTKEDYSVPPDFPGLDILRNAWNIVMGDETIQVVLRFDEKVKARVLETRWHPSQQTREDTNKPGSLLWEVQVADTLDLLPWVRGWGADVEVLEPEGLRKELTREAARMAMLYQVGNTSSLPAYQLLWAKTNDEKTLTHPLICHIIDVAQVTLVLWKHVLAESIRKQISKAVGLDDDSAARVVAFWIGLHDLGKASPVFQRQYAPAIAILSKAGLDFETQIGQTSCRHDIITTQVLAELLTSETGLAGELSNNVAITVGGHHGTWPTSQDLDAYAAPSQIGSSNWDRVRQELVRRLKEILDVPSVSFALRTAEETNSFCILLGGLTSISDWIGSQQKYFPPTGEVANLEKYWRDAERNALQALQETGWIGWRPPSTAISFGALCDVKQLRPLQEASVTLAEKLDQPALVIIEAPTGVGKTEAALYLADHWARTLQQRGMYVAMPTMATSNQMFKRVRKILERRYPSELVNYQLLHGNALLMDDEQVPRLAKVDKGDEHNIVAALEWFTKRKRGLLAPFGVGTVDQTLMGILQTRHFFVRLFGLSHKTVIFDEVHAYDAYMDELFYLLLRWLQAVNASVVILSATLSDVSRRRILEAYSPKLEEMPVVSYPAITWTSDNTVQVIALNAETRTVNIESVGRDPVEIAHRLADELSDGGCAAVICNTVRRAQEIYREIDAAKIVPEDDLILFHARFLWEQREAIERDVLARFGKPESGEFRPRKKTIVVATQVIEQSLDLDFDLIVSDLAPIDLLIQRIGRLHRHSENDEHRPVRLKEKRVFIAIPEIENGTPQLERGDMYVYEKYVLMRSWAVLRQRGSITTPAETQKLIEAVYGDEILLSSDLPESFHHALTDAKEKMEKEERKAKSQAQSKLISMPDNDFMLEQSNAGLEEDNPVLHEYRQAATRLAPPSITLICIYKTPNGLVLSQQSTSPTVDLSQEPDRANTRSLLNRKVEVADYRVVKYFANQEPPTGWRKNPWLRFARVVDFSEGGEYLPKDEDWKLRLDHKLGLIVEDV